MKLNQHWIYKDPNMLKLMKKLMKWIAKMMTISKFSINIVTQKKLNNNV